MSSEIGRFGGEGVGAGKGGRVGENGLGVSRGVSLSKPVLDRVVVLPCAFCGNKWAARVSMGIFG